MLQKTRIVTTYKRRPKTAQEGNQQSSNTTQKPQEVVSATSKKSINTIITREEFNTSSESSESSEEDIEQAAPKFKANMARKVKKIARKPSAKPDGLNTGNFHSLTQEQASENASPRYVRKISLMTARSTSKSSMALKALKAVRQNRNTPLAMSQSNNRQTTNETGSYIDLLEDKHSYSERKVDHARGSSIGDKNTAFTSDASVESASYDSSAAREQPEEVETSLIPCNVETTKMSLNKQQSDSLERESREEAFAMSENVCTDSQSGSLLPIRDSDTSVEPFLVDGVQSLSLSEKSHFAQSTSSVQYDSILGEYAQGTSVEHNEIEAETGKSMLSDIAGIYRIGFQDMAIQETATAGSSQDAAVSLLDQPNESVTMPISLLNSPRLEADNGSMTRKRFDSQSPNGIKTIGIELLADDITKLHLKDQSFEERTEVDLCEILSVCSQKSPVGFSEALSGLTLERKLGEATFSEVYSYFEAGQPSVRLALKVIPFGSCPPDTAFNGGALMTTKEVKQEILITRLLSEFERKDQDTSGNLSHDSNFVELKNAHICTGAYPKELLDAWDDYSEIKGSENDRPDIFPQSQLYAVIILVNGGIDLEHFKLKPVLPSPGVHTPLCKSFGSVDRTAPAANKTWRLVRSILMQVILSLGSAERSLQFEHRDLHWGNVLCKADTKYLGKSKSYHFDSGHGHSGVIDVSLEGVFVTIIDYTLSRCENSGDVLYHAFDDESYFTGKGDIQYEVYRMMRTETSSEWASFRPKTNLMWIQYLVKKILSSKALPTSGTATKKNRTDFGNFAKRLLEYRSVNDMIFHEFFEVSSEAWFTKPRRQ